MEKIKLLLCCNKGKPQIFYEPSLDKPFVCGYEKKKNKQLNGKIVAECDFEVEEYRVEEYGNEMRVKCKVLYGNVGQYSGNDEMLKNILKGSCLTIQELTKYMTFKDMWGTSMYAIHIKNLNIFDEPKELSECMSIKTFENDFVRKTLSPEMVSKAPQNMMKVKMWVDGKEFGMWKNYVLISIRPEYLVKILNKEKTIEIRKKVLKEMVK